jgi:hypothetical protein
MSRSAADLPEDPAELRRFAAALAAEVHAKTLLIEKLRMQLSILRRARFGRSSEKLDREIEHLELLLGDIEESDAERQARTEASDGEASSTLPSKKPSVRKSLPDHLSSPPAAPTLPAPMHMTQRAASWSRCCPPHCVCAVSTARKADCCCRR